MNKTVINLLKIFLGLVFIFSGISKLFPIESFEFQLVNLGIINWELVPYLSRSLIIFEIFLGISLLQNGYVKKFYLPAAIILLIIFSIHLGYALLTEGLGENCGCFGQLLPMNNLEALIKNIVLITIAVFIYKKIDEDKKVSLAIPAAILVAVFALVFIIFPAKAYKVQNEVDVQDYVPFSKTITENTTLGSAEDSVINEANVNNEKDIKEKVNSPEKENLNKENQENKKAVKVYPSKKSEFHNINDFSNGKVNLDEGVKIVTLFSLDCEHCMETANKIGELKNETDLPPVYVLFLGFEEELPNFWNKAGTTYPYKILDPQTFFPMINDYPPRVVLLNNGNIIDEWDYESFSKKKLQNAISKF